jgi:hypothetical protein
MNSVAVVPLVFVKKSTRALKSTAAALFCATDVPICAGAVDILAKTFVSIMTMEVVRWTRE